MSWKDFLRNKTAPINLLNCLYTVEKNGLASVLLKKKKSTRDPSFVDITYFSRLFHWWLKGCFYCLLHLLNLHQNPCLQGLLFGKPVIPGLVLSLASFPLCYSCAGAGSKAVPGRFTADDRRSGERRHAKTRLQLRGMCQVDRCPLLSEECH